MLILNLNEVWRPIFALTAENWSFSLSQQSRQPPYISILACMVHAHALYEHVTHIYKLTMVIYSDTWWTDPFDRSDQTRQGLCYSSKSFLSGGCMTLVYITSCSNLSFHQEERLTRNKTTHWPAHNPKFIGMPSFFAFWMREEVRLCAWQRRRSDHYWVWPLELSCEMGCHCKILYDKWEKACTVNHYSDGHLPTHTHAH